MRIVDQKSVGTLAGTRAARGSGAARGARFTLDSGGTLQRAEGQAPISILGGLEALIAIQTEDTTRERRRRSARRGAGMLDVLDELKLAILGGGVPADLQARLGASLRDGLPSGDPRLDTIVDAIELRAEVELAKLKLLQRRRSDG
jgi:hypothetical protein